MYNGQFIDKKNSKKNNTANWDRCIRRLCCWRHGKLF